ncbi:hypothetical protein P5V93_21215 [Mycobacteroides abscessus subsp. abscessus]|nr:hypothetical protein [Mycobacteroides abscessus]MDO3099878.1 hypothetical protein [Mycobacteroides abscessus subsp. abscessus]MDO3287039.1 hypothetical protein [Mycobacteroides abscessus subsp. abscessus]MDO3369482.1 hypothetical protein [Mycobacteroides abscessus subsp. abscessus]SHV51007.1 Uncharacterised protein [Mycobacteroides abscessus subsp. abscessus]SHV86824.1 Uncharacterised protein [Mycobacteroides abscessus subsp. abscessus]
MPRKNVLIAVGAVIAVVALVFGGVYLLRPEPTTPDTSCQTVGELLKYSDDELARIKKHNDEVAETRDADRQDEAIPMYQKWAATVRDYAEKVSDPEAKGIALQMSDAADEVTEREIQFLGKPAQEQTREQHMQESTDNIIAAGRKVKDAEAKLRSKCPIGSSDTKL